MAEDNEVVTVLLRALETYHPWTHQHGLRVSTYARLLANVYGFAPGEVEDIGHAALLHDLGHLGVPTGILDKPGSLTEAELRLVHLHPEMGFRILDRLRSLPQSVPVMVRYHHERWDGTGYPESLKGEQIPLGSQVIAVAEAYDYMTAEHPWRTRCSVQEARDRLLTARGKQVHPELAEVFCDLPLLTAQY